MHRKPHSEATKLRISLAKRGKPSNRRGATLSFESRRKVSIGKRGIPVHSKEQRNKWKLERTGQANPAWIHGQSHNLSMYRQHRARREQEALGFHSEGEWQTLKAQYGFTCPCCKRSEPTITLTRDHIIPLVKGGSHFIENIQPLCRSCNSRKNTKTIIY